MTDKPNQLATSDPGSNDFGNTLNVGRRQFGDMSGTTPGRVSSGLPGLDEVLDGGFVERRAYMVSGGSGTGKTIVGYHFLDAGVRVGESTLYVAFEEAESDVRANAASLGFDLDEVTVLDLSTDPEWFLGDEQYTVFRPSEVEREPVVERIATAVEDVDPDRVFIDPLNQLRHVTPDGYQFEQTAAAMMGYLKRQDATVLFSAQASGSTAVAEDLQYLCDGAIELRHGLRNRTLRVVKLRGSGFQGGRHSLKITGDGMEVFPKLVPGKYGTADTHTYDQLSTGVPEFDDLLGGGIEGGTVTVVAGPSGVGKTTLGTSLLTETAKQGHRAAAYLFEESQPAFEVRSANIGFPIDELTDEGTLGVEAVEPLELSADEFAAHVRSEVETNDTEVVMIDGTSGYRLALHDEEDDLVRELRAICRYLTNTGVTVVLTEEVPDVTGEFRPTEGRISHIADNIVFLRYLEVEGQIRKAAGVLKKRFGEFEPALRELRITGSGIELGRPLNDLRGVLTGTPELIGGSGPDRS